MGQRERKQEKEWGRQRVLREGGFFTRACHYGVHLIIIINVSLSLCHSPLCLSLSSIMAVSWSSSDLLLLLLISSLDWMCNPGSAFLIGRDDMTSSGRLLVFCVVMCQDKYAEKIDWCEENHPLSAHQSLYSTSNINKCDSGFVHRMLLTLAITSYVSHQLQNAVFAQIHVEMFVVEQTPHFPGLARQTGWWSIELGKYTVWASLSKSRDRTMQDVQPANPACHWNIWNKCEWVQLKQI